MTDFHPADQTIRRRLRVQVPIRLQVTLKGLDEAIVELAVPLLEALKPVFHADFVAHVHLPLLVAVQFADILLQVCLLSGLELHARLPIGQLDVKLPHLLVERLLQHGAESARAWPVQL